MKAIIKVSVSPQKKSKTTYDVYALNFDVLYQKQDDPSVVCIKSKVERVVEGMDEAIIIKYCKGGMSFHELKWMESVLFTVADLVIVASTISNIGTD